MGTRMAAIGVDRSIGDDVLLEALARVAHRLDDQDELPYELVAVAPPAEDGEPLRWLTLGCREPDEPDFGLSGSFVLDVLAERIPALIWVVHDDRIGQYSFAHLRDGRRVLALRSDGPYVDAIVGEITADHPQRGFSHEALQALHDKPEEALTDAEAAAIMEYEDAVTIGLDQLFPGATRRYLDLMYARTGLWWLARDGRVLERPEPAAKQACHALPGWLVPSQLDALGVGAPPRTEGDWFFRALERWRAGDPEGAFEDLGRAIEAGPEQVPPHMQRILLGDELLRAEEVLASAGTLRARGVWFERMDDAEARALSQLGRHAEAVAVLERYLGTHADDDVAHYNAACYAALASAGAGTAAERERWRVAALDALTRAVALDPANGPDAVADPDFASLLDDPGFRRLTAG